MECNRKISRSDGRHRKHDQRLWSPQEKVTRTRPPLLPPPRACDSRAMCAARVCAGAVSIEAGKVDINLLSMAFFNEAKQRGSPFFVDEMVEAAMVY